MTVAAGSTTGQVALTATAGADYGDRSVTLRAEGGGVVKTSNIHPAGFPCDRGVFTKASPVYGSISRGQAFSRAQASSQSNCTAWCHCGLRRCSHGEGERQGGVGKARTACPVQPRPDERAKSERSAVPAFAPALPRASLSQEKGRG